MLSPVFSFAVKMHFNVEIFLEIFDQNKRPFRTHLRTCLQTFKLKDTRYILQVQISTNFDLN